MSNFHTAVMDNDEDTIVMGGKKLARYPPEKSQEKMVTYLIR